MGVHRRHAGGVWGRTFDRGAQEEIERMTKRLITFERLADCMPARYQRRLRRQRALASFHLAVAYRARREWRRAASLLARAFREDPWAGIPFLRFAAAMGVQMWQRGRRGDGG
jgi:hypothetical protein